IPTFQNPTGRTMPVERRQAVADVLLRTDVPLIEDDPYGALSFTGSTWAPIAALPGMSERTILLNSMSKLMSPGVRIGWMRAEGPVLEDRKSTRLNSSHVKISYAVFCLKKKNQT